MLDVFLLVAKILFYTTCAAYIRSLYKDKEYVPHEEYHLLRNEHNRIVAYNKELKIKLQELDLQSDSIIDGRTGCTTPTNLKDMVLAGYHSKSIQERLSNCCLPKATNIRVMNSLGDLYLTQGTGEIYVKIER